MTEKDYAAIISANLKRISIDAGKTQSDICRDLKIGKSTVSSWFTGDRIPRMDKIDMLCRYFGVSRAEIMEPFSAPKIDPLTAAELEFIRKYRHLDGYKRELVETMISALTDK